MTVLRDKFDRLIQGIAGKILSWPRLSAIILGFLAATGFPPLALWPVSLIAIAGLCWLIFEAPSWKAAGKLGWLFGVGHFTLANNWIATAFTYQAEMPVALGWAGFKNLTRCPCLKNRLSFKCA